jgi:hypothetical protein
VLLKVKVEHNCIFDFEFRSCNVNGVRIVVDCVLDPNVSFMLLNKCMGENCIRPSAKCVNDTLQTRNRTHNLHDTVR